MASKLALIAFTGFTVAAVCIGAAAAIGARNMHTDGFDFTMFGGKPFCGRDDEAAGASARDIAWDGEDQATLSIPGEAHYRPGGSDMLHVSGDPRLVAAALDEALDAERRDRRTGRDRRVLVAGLVARRAGGGHRGCVAGESGDGRLRGAARQQRSERGEGEE